MQIWCDESGGVGRGVMTLAALALETEAAERALHDLRLQTGLRGELKGSRIDLETRALVFDLLDREQWTCVVSVALSVTTPPPGQDRGAHDVDVYAALLEAAVEPLLPLSGGCAAVTIDDGRYSDAILGLIREDLASMIGPCGLARLEESHRAAGLQLADVIANSFFNRALPTDRQGPIAAIVQPRLEAGRIRMRVLQGEAATNR